MEFHFFRFYWFFRKPMLRILDESIFYNGMKSIAHNRTQLKKSRLFPNRDSVKTIQKIFSVWNSPIKLTKNTSSKQMERPKQQIALLIKTSGPIQLAFSSVEKTQVMHWTTNRANVGISIRCFTNGSTHILEWTAIIHNVSNFQSNKVQFYH